MSRKIIDIKTDENIKSRIKEEILKYTPLPKLQIMMMDEFNLSCSSVDKLKKKCIQEIQEQFKEFKSYADSALLNLLFEQASKPDLRMSDRIKLFEFIAKITGVLDNKILAENITDSQPVTYEIVEVKKIEDNKDE